MKILLAVLVSAIMLTGCQTKETSARFASAQSDIQACYTTVAQAQAAQQTPQNLANAAAQKLGRATAQKKLADAGLANVKKQVAAAVTASAAAEKAAQDFEKTAEGKSWPSS